MISTNSNSTRVGLRKYYY